MSFYILEPFFLKSFLLDSRSRSDLVAQSWLFLSDDIHWFWFVLFVCFCFFLAYFDRWTGAGMVVEESSPVLLLTLGACSLTLLMTLCIVCHRKRQRRRPPNINHERRPFAPPPPFDTSSRPSMSLPSDIPSPPPPATLYTSLPPLSIDVGDNVWRTEGRPRVLDTIIHM